jgi:dTDP-4-dehydrorhamnose 3,5-epimerase
MAGIAVHPLDPALGIAWPIAIDPSDTSMLSAKDAAQPPLADVLR